MASTGHAELLAYDGFDYAAGTDLFLNPIAGGEGWTGPWTKANNNATGPGQAMVLFGSMRYVDSEGNTLRTSGNALNVKVEPEVNNQDARYRRVLAESIGTEPGTYYVSFIFKREGEKDPGDYNGTGQTRYHPNEYARNANIAFMSGNGERGGIGNGSNSLSDTWKVWSGNRLGPNTPAADSGVPFAHQQAFVVLRVDVAGGALGGNLFSLYHNPVLTEEVENTPVLIAEGNDNDAGYVFELTALQINAGNLGGDRSPAEIVIDELRVGTTWDAVTPYREPTPTVEQFVNDWGFEKGENAGQYAGGFSFVPTGNGSVLLEADTISTGNSGDIRLRGMFDPVTLESGETLTLTGGFTLGTSAQLLVEPVVVEGFESLVESITEDGETVEVPRFIADTNSSSIPGYTLELNSDSAQGDHSLRLIYYFAADAQEDGDGEGGDGGDGGEGGEGDDYPFNATAISVVRFPATPIDLTDKTHLSLDYKVRVPMVPQSDDVEFMVALLTGTEENERSWYYTATDVLTDDSGEWQTIVIPFADFELPVEEPDAELPVNAIQAFAIAVVAHEEAAGSVYSGEILVDNLQAFEGYTDADVYLAGVETRIALFNTNEAGGELGEEADAGFWTDASANASGYMVVLRTGGSVNWANGASGVFGALVNDNWVSTGGKNVGLGGGNQNTVPAPTTADPEARRDANALAGDYTFEISVTYLWDSRSLVSYKIEGGNDGYVLEGSLIDRGAAGGVVSTNTFDAVGFRFNGSPFTEVQFEDVIIGHTPGETISPYLLFTFDEDVEGWSAFVDGDTVQAAVSRADDQLAIAPVGAGSRWVARRDMSALSIPYEAVRDAIESSEYVTSLGIAFDVTFRKDRSGEFTGAYAIDAAIISGEHRTEFLSALATEWTDKESVTESVVLPLRSVGFDPEVNTLTLLVGVNSANDEDHSILIDNVRIVSLPLTNEEMLGAAETFFGEVADENGIVTVTWGEAEKPFFVSLFPWVYNYDLSDSRFEPSRGLSVGWIYIVGSSSDAWFWAWDHSLGEWWGSTQSVYPWCWVEGSGWSNIENPWK